MRKKVLALILIPALCLCLAAPVAAVEKAAEPDTFEDDYILITNVIEQRTIDELVGFFYVKDSLTGVAPVTITPISDGEFSYFVKVDWVPTGKELKDLEADGLEDFLPENSRAELTEAGTYYIWQISRNSEGGGGFTGYLLTVQQNGTPVDPAPSANPNFTDVSTGAYYADAVTWAVKQGITNGTSDTTFSPDQTCTRAQIITFLWRAAGCPEPKGASPFSDVAAGAYYAKATAWAAENGMVGGISFSPDAPCTREMAVEFMWKHAGSPEAAKAGFSDVSSGAVNWAVEKGVTKGTSDTLFSPAQTCTRGQIVTFLHRAFAQQSSGGNEPAEEENGQASSKYPLSDVDMTKIKGLYRQEKDPEYEIEAQFANPRIYYQCYRNNEKYGRIRGGYGNAKIWGNHVYATADDGARSEMWFYPDYLIYESSRPSQQQWNGKYILVDQQEEQKKIQQQDQQDQQMERKYPDSGIDLATVNGLYRKEGSEPYQVFAYYGNEKLSYRLENYQDEDEDILPPYSKLTISGSHAYFNSEKHKLRTDIWVYPDYLILEFSGEGAKEFEQYNGKYTLFNSFKGI